MTGGPGEPGRPDPPSDRRIPWAAQSRETTRGGSAREATSALPEQPARLTAWVEGRVQGVGFRWWVRARALELGLVGFAENLLDGRVKVVAEGPADRCRNLLALLEGGSTPGRVSRVTHRWSLTTGEISSFTER